MTWTGSDIRRARTARGWTQKQFSAELGASLRSVAAWERDEAEPSAAWVGALNKLFADDTPPDTTQVALVDASDTELLGEFLRRLNEARRSSGSSRRSLSVGDAPSVGMDEQHRVIDGPPESQDDDGVQSNG